MVEENNPMSGKSELTEGAVIDWLEQQPPEIRKRIVCNFCCLCGNELLKCKCIKLDWSPPA